MIQKVLETKADSYVRSYSKKMIDRKILKPAIGTMAVLAGASMSNGHGPRFEPTEMIIPDGLTFSERFYYNLKGKMPPSVYERWVPKTEDSVIEANDEIITVNIGGRYIGSVVEGPHKALLNPEDVSNTTSQTDGESILSDEEIRGLVSPDTEASMAMVDIFRHLFGL